MPPFATTWMYLEKLFLVKMNVCALGGRRAEGFLVLSQ